METILIYQGRRGPPSLGAGRAHIPAATRPAYRALGGAEKGRQMSTQSLSQGDLLRMVITRFVGGAVILGALFFGTAGTFAYWHAWLFLAVLFLPMLGALIYLIRRDPALLERRMRTRERETQQQWIIGLSVVAFVFAYVLPGLDYRFGWSHVPVWVVWVAAAMVLLGYGLFFLVMKENSYASRVVEVNEGQTVIDTGPYAYVRHPMYVAALLMFLFAPLALGSYWAVIPSLLIVGVFVARILNEEVVLRRDLAGYPAYMQKVRFRLLPGVW